MVERKNSCCHFVYKYDISHTLGRNRSKLSCERTKTGKSRAGISVWHGKFKREPEYSGFDGAAVFDNAVICFFIYGAAFDFGRKNSMDFDGSDFVFFSISDICFADRKSCDGFEKQRSDAWGNRNMAGSCHRYHSNFIVLDHRGAICK